MNTYLGIDIGGTFVKMAVIDEEGTIVSSWKIPTDVRDNGERIPGDIIESARRNLEKGVSGVGIGVPGAVSNDGERVERAVNLGWVDVALKSTVEEGLGAPAVLLNDANAAALGEMWKGAAQGTRDFLFVTLGTGVGGALVLDGKLRNGAHASAGEIGHIPVRSHEHRICGCGNVNCLETFASANGLVETMRRLLCERSDDRDAFTAQDIMGWVSEGDEVACEALKRTVDALGESLAGLLNALDVEEIVIGGGLSHAGKTLLDPLAHVIDRHAFPQIRGGYSLHVAQLGNDAGVLGSAYAAKTRE